MYEVSIIYFTYENNKKKRFGWNVEAVKGKSWGEYI